MISLRSALTALLAMVSLLVLSCGGDGKPAAANDPAEILKASVAAVEGVQTFHFKLDHENGTTPMPLNLELISAEGDVAVPDRVKAEIRAKASALSVRLDVIGIGEDTWITNPFSRRWERLPGAALRDIANPAALVEALVGSLQDVKLEGRNEIDGASTHHLRGSIDSGKLADALPIAEPGFTASVDLYVAESDSLPRRARISGRLSNNDAENIVRQVDFSRFDEPVKIQAP
jgi:hypothetical protein